MLSQQIRNYIETAVTDGTLTPQELEFLKNKARELGDDPVETEMTAKTLAAQQKQRQRPEQNKCPNCGAFIEQMTGICPFCKSERGAEKQDSFLYEEFRQKTELFINEYYLFAPKKLKALKIIKFLLMLFFFVIFLSDLNINYQNLAVKYGIKEWYPNLTVSSEDNTSEISIEAKTDEQKERAEMDGEYTGRIRWQNMTAEEQQAYKIQRTEEIKNIDHSVDIFVLFLLLFGWLSLLATYTLPPAPSAQAKEAESAFLMYPLPLQQAAIFDSLTLLTGNIKKISPTVFLLTKKGKITTRVNKILKQKIDQIYRKSLLLFAKEPQTIQKLKEMVKSYVNC